MPQQEVVVIPATPPQEQLQFSPNSRRSYVQAPSRQQSAVFRQPQASQSPTYDPLDVLVDKLNMPELRTLSKNLTVEQVF